MFNMVVVDRVSLWPPLTGQLGSSHRGARLTRSFIASSSKFQHRRGKPTAEAQWSHGISSYASRSLLPCILTGGARSTVGDFTNDMIVLLLTAELKSLFRLG